MGKRVRVMTIFGTRPEAIKCAPVIKELERRGISQYICVTGQHKEMLDPMLDLFDIVADTNLAVMQSGQQLESLTGRILEGLSGIMKDVQPEIVLVQGDTTTAFIAGLAAYYNKYPVGHIEAGLRTDDKYNPFPEEMNRRLLSTIADLNFAPTEQTRKNLVACGIAEEAIVVTGNTVIDALHWVAEQDHAFEDKRLNAVDFGKRIILVTSHRRENLGEGMESIFSALKQLVDAYDDVQIIFPVHLNPTILAHSQKILGGLDNVILLAPLGYADLIQVMKRCYLVMTDSGGLQEEAPALGKPVLVLRSNTERPEGIAAGTAQLVGLDAQTIYKSAAHLLDDPEAYRHMAVATNPYGDGKAAQRIVDAIERFMPGE